MQNLPKKDHSLVHVLKIMKAMDLSVHSAIRMINAEPVVPPVRVTHFTAWITVTAHHSVLNAIRQISVTQLPERSAQLTMYAVFARFL